VEGPRDSIVRCFVVVSLTAVWSASERRKEAPEFSNGNSGGGGREVWIGAFLVAVRTT